MNENQRMACRIKWFKEYVDAEQHPNTRRVGGYFDSQFHYTPQTVSFKKPSLDDYDESNHRETTG